MNRSTHQQIPPWVLPTSPITPSWRDGSSVECYFEDDSLSPTRMRAHLEKAGKVGLELIDELNSKNQLVEQISNRLKHMFLGGREEGLPATDISHSFFQSNETPMVVHEYFEKEILRLEKVIANQQREMDILNTEKSRADGLYLQEKAGVDKLLREIGDQSKTIQLLKSELKQKAGETELLKTEKETLRHQLVEQNKFFQKEIKKYVEKDVGFSVRKQAMIMAGTQTGGLVDKSVKTVSSSAQTSDWSLFRQESLVAAANPLTVERIGIHTLETVNPSLSPVETARILIQPLQQTLSMEILNYSILHAPEIAKPTYRFTQTDDVPMHTVSCATTSVPTHSIGTSASSVCTTRGIQTDPSIILPLEESLPLQRNNKVSVSQSATAPSIQTPTNCFKYALPPRDLDGDVLMMTVRKDGMGDRIPVSHRLSFNFLNHINSSPEVDEASPRELKQMLRKTHGKVIVMKAMSEKLSEILLTN